MTDHLDLQPEQLLGVINSTFDRLFFGADKPKAKKLYRQLREGASPEILTIDGGDRGDVKCYLALDASECKGRIGFALFRRVLAAQLQRVAEHLRSGKGPNIFTSEQTNAMIFNIPGVIEYNGQVYILVTGVEQSRAGVLTIRLQFLDPAQFSAFSGHTSGAG